MLGDAQLVGFVATMDSTRATAFYRDALGLRLVADEAHALVFDANGTMLRIQKVKAPVRAPYTVLGWAVRDIAALVRGLAAKGVVFERYEGFPQDADGIWTTPSGERVAWFRDPDGNLLSLTQF